MNSLPDGLPSPLAQKPVEAVWLQAAAAIGFRVERQTAAFASSDGKGCIAIGVDEILDVNDSVAQLVFHELCHGLVAGPDNWSSPDWGLSNGDARDVVQEHACLRVQVHLAEPHRLRELMAPTTEYRSYHDRISGEPLSDPTDPAAAVALAAIARPAAASWISVLDRALAETREWLDAAATASVDRAPAALHPVGFPFGERGETCETCAWRYRGGRGRPVERCRQSAGPDGVGRRTEAHFRACERWEARMDCLQCGACCREAYHSVTVSMRDPVVWKQPNLIVRYGHRFEVRREGERCAALREVSPPPEAPGMVAATPAVVKGEGAPTPPRAFSCAIYDDRPRTCREFEANGPHCLVARRRVGLSR